MRKILVAFVAAMLLKSVAMAQSLENGFVGLVDKVSNTVVSISTVGTVKGSRSSLFPQFPKGTPFDDFFRQFEELEQAPQKSRSLGSGFVISEDGYIITNNHVIENADEISIEMLDSKKFKAKLIGTDSKTDIALLKIDSKEKLKYAEFADSSKAKIGEWAIAIGNPFGLGNTVTSGIVSAIGRDINSGPYDNFIQTDAPINQGNSGGPLFNIKGQVIGVNSAIFSQSGGNVGIGFAIPSNTAKEVVEQLKNKGFVQRGWLGVVIQPVNEDIANATGLVNKQGALIIEINKGSPAENSKLKVGDIVIEFNGTKINDAKDLSRAVANTKVDTNVKLKVFNNGKISDVNVTIGKLSDNETNSKKQKESQQDFKDLGFSLSDITPDIAARFNFKDQKGVVITSVTPNSEAAEKGLKAGYIIQQFDYNVVNNVKDFEKNYKIAKKAKKAAILLMLNNGKSTFFSALKVPYDNIDNKTK